MSKLQPLFSKTSDQAINLGVIFNSELSFIPPVKELVKTGFIVFGIYPETTRSHGDANVSD